MRSFMAIVISGLMLSSHLYTTNYLYEKLPKKCRELEEVISELRVASPLMKQVSNQSGQVQGDREVKLSTVGSVASIFCHLEEIGGREWEKGVSVPGTKEVQ